MSLPVSVRFLLCAVPVLAIALPSGAQNAFDPRKLDEHIDFRLADTSMADAAAALAKIADIKIAAPAEPEKGLIVNLKDQPVKTVLDMLSRASGLGWYIEAGVIVFRRPAEIPRESVAREPLEKLPTEDGMTAMLRLLDAPQLYRLSRGIPLSYGELTASQQEIIKSMLSPQTVGLTESGTAVRSLPAPEQTSLSFYVMPYLHVPKPGTKDSIALRLDSTPYIFLKKTGGQ